MPPDTSPVTTVGRAGGGVQQLHARRQPHLGGAPEELRMALYAATAARAVSSSYTDPARRRIRQKPEGGVTTAGCFTL